MRLNSKRILSICVAFILVATVAFTVFSANTATQSLSNNNFTGESPKYVFMFIGDGMTYPQIAAAEAFLGRGTYMDQKVDIQKMNFSAFPIAGAASTFDSTSFCPDSASTATSLASGNKTHSGVLNMDVTKTIKFKTIAELLKAQGKKVGIISSVSIDHATPAAYYAHQPSRGNAYEIAVELANSNFDFFGGGGLLSPKGSKGDQKDALEIAKENGYKIANTKNDIVALNSNSGKVIAINPILDSSKALPYEIDRAVDDLSIADYTKKGIEVLDNPDGFFMMVEGGKIDWACHANDAASSIRDTLAFNNAVHEAVTFYWKHPKDTLILVTGDHETGGLSMGFAATGYSTFFDKISYQTKSYELFDKNVIAPYRAYNNKDTAMLEDLLPSIKSYFGLVVSTDVDAAKRPGMVLTAFEVQKIRDALKQSVTPSKERALNDDEKVLYGTYEPLSVTLTHILNNKAGIGWSSYSHTGVPAGVFAMGVGQDLFSGYYDNTDVFKKLSSIMKLK